MKGSEQIAPLSDANVTTSRLAINFRKDAGGMLIEAAAAIRLGLTPRIDAVFWHDTSADVWYDLLKTGPDIRDRAQTGTAGFILASADHLYIGTNARTSGYRFDITTVNSTNSSANVSQHNSATGWTTVTSFSDGTDDATDVFAQDGTMTFTLPGADAWPRRNLEDLVTSAAYPLVPEPLHWFRYSADANLTVVTINQLIALTGANPTAGTMDSSTADMGFFKATTEYTINVTDESGGIEVIAQAAANTTLNITWLGR